MDSNARPAYMLSTGDPLQTWGHSQTKVRDGKSSPCNGNQKKAGVAIFISNKIDFEINTLTSASEIRMPFPSLAPLFAICPTER